MTGREPIRMLVASGRVKRGPHNYIPSAVEVQSCCYDLFDWSAAGLRNHLATPKHVALKFKVGHRDLLQRLNEAFLQQRKTV